MKVSPEPLHPLRNWRELWHAEPASFHHNPSARIHEARWKQSKRPAFHWLTQLLNREGE